MQSHRSLHPPATADAGRRVLALLLGLLLALCGAASAQTIYVVGNDASFGSFDLQTFAYTQIKAALVQSDEDTNRFVEDLAPDGAGGFYAALTQESNAFTGQPVPPKYGLISISAAGNVTSIGGENGLGTEVSALARAADGTVYYTGGFEDFGTVDTTAGTLTKVGTTSDNVVTVHSAALAFVGSTLYLAALHNGGSGDNFLYKVDPATGACTSISSSDVRYQEIALFSSGGTLYALDGTDVYSLDQTNGAFTKLGTISGANVPQKGFYGVSVLIGTAGPASVGLHSFAGPDTEGANPVAPLIQANDGNFYGTTSTINTTSKGSIFELSADGKTFQTLYLFTGDDGMDPEGALLQGSDGNFYGTTNRGGTSGYGTVFQLSADGKTLNTLHSFSLMGDDGGNPYGALVQGSDGAFYGTTNRGGTNNKGMIYRITADGTVFTNFYSFTGIGDNGSNPDAGLTLGRDGNFYGTTTQGGTGSAGTVFQLSADGQTLTTLHSFAKDGSEGNGSQAALLQGSDGIFYGTSPYSGANSVGTLFEVSGDGMTFNVLSTFSNSGDGGYYPIGSVIQGSDGNFYFPASHTNAGGGLIYELSADGKTLSTLLDFPQNSDAGNNLEAALLQAGDGNFYSTALYGGTAGENGDGTIYRVTDLLPDVVQLHLSINSVFETASTAMVRVDRIGDDGSSALSVDYTTADGTATDGTAAKAGTDYTAKSDTLSWAQGDVLPKFIAVPITDRGFTDGSLRTLTLALSNVQETGGSGTTLGNPTSATLTINGSIPGAPVIMGANTAMGTEYQPFSYQIQASASPTSYGVSGLPDGLTLAEKTGAITGMPTGSGVFQVTISATNAAGAGTAILTLTITQVVPTITSPATDTAQVGVPYSYQIVANANPIKYGVIDLPAGLSVNKQTGLLSGTPVGSGTFTLTLKATNDTSMGTETLTLTVSPKTPVITSSATVTAQVGQPFSYQIQATSSPTLYGVIGLRPGLSVNKQTGLFSGTPVGSGTFMLTLKATNAGGTGTLSLTLTIKPSTPVITSVTAVTAQVGQPFSYQIKATSSPASYGVGGLFQGLKVDQQTGLITGTPTAAGTHTLNLRATNGGGTGTKNLTVTVTK